jgi:hypothetical protein
MAHKNIHQRKRLKSHKPAAAVKPSSQPAAVTQAAATPLRAVPARASVVQEAAAVRFAELPYELQRIALFFAFVVVLLIVLWFFLK